MTAAGGLIKVPGPVHIGYRGAWLSGDGAAAELRCELDREGHHLRHWADGGETSLKNTCLLCSLHHRFVHEHGYTIILGNDHRPVFRDRSGRVVVPVPVRYESESIGWPSLLASHADLAIDAETIAREWDGKPTNYGDIIGHLLHIDDAE